MKPVGSTFPFQIQQITVAALQTAFRLPITPLNPALQLQKILLAESGAEHFPPPLHQVMSLINQKEILSLYTLREKALQAHIGIKNIIVIADYGVCPVRHIQAHFEGADLILMSPGEKRFPIQVIRPLRQKPVDGLIYSVVMPFCIGAAIGIAVRFRADA